MHRTCDLILYPVLFLNSVLYCITMLLAIAHYIELCTCQKYFNNSRDEHADGIGWQVCKIKHSKHRVSIISIYTQLRNTSQQPEAHTQAISCTRCKLVFTVDCATFICKQVSKTIWEASYQNVKPFSVWLWHTMEVAVVKSECWVKHALIIYFTAAL